MQDLFGRGNFNEHLCLPQTGGSHQSASERRGQGGHTLADIREGGFH